jgi:DNA-binding MarR family transcriptional regulator
MTAEDIFLDETIHQPTRLRVMTMLVSQSEEGRLAYGFIQKTLGLTGGNLTTHLRKLEEAGFVAISKEFLGTKPRTWVEATQEGRQAFAEYLVNLERALNWPN